MMYELLKNNERIAVGSIEKLVKRIPKGCQLRIGRNIQQQRDQFQWHSLSGDKFVIQKFTEIKTTT